MELDLLLNELKLKYSFKQADAKEAAGFPDLDVRFVLDDSHIGRLVEKANRLNAIVESCANVVTIFDSSTPKEELLKTSIRCVGSYELHIYTTQSMIKLLVEALFD